MGYGLNSVEWWMVLRTFKCMKRKKKKLGIMYISYENQLEKDGQWIYWDKDGEKN